MLEDGSNSEVLHQGAIWDITNINRTDSGTYHCTAYNGFGNPISRAVNVNVLCKHRDNNSLVSSLVTLTDLFSLGSFHGKEYFKNCSLGCTS